jgi:hypothetical protein
MALIKCKECQAEISDKAVACPKCGAEMVKGKTRGMLLTIITVGLILVALFFVMDAMFNTNKREMRDFEKSLDDGYRARKNAEKLIGN